MTCGRSLRLVFDPLTKAQVQQLTKIAHRIVGATAPDDRCLTDQAGNGSA